MYLNHVIYWMHLLNNIALPIKIDKQKLHEAISLANLGDFIKTLLSGVNTFVGNDGIKFLRERR